MTPKAQNTAQGILFTDQYQLTMAQLYFRMGVHEKHAQFDHFFRKYPDYGSHQAGYCINAGLEQLIDWMRDARFGDEEIEYLRSQTGRKGERVFGDDFLVWLRDNGNFDGITLRAIPEGRVVHPNVPLTVVQGPLAMAQILETALLNQLNYPILIATKAARIKGACRQQPLLEFGVRRGPDTGVNAGIRAALIGGADYSSCVGISRALGFPPKGTHAHSMVQVFLALDEGAEGELGAFRAFAEIYPDDCVLLVDTIDTLQSGVPNAITVFEELRRRGHEPVGIRLDSGDLAFLSIQSAKMLNEAGFPDTKIFLSNELDELVIWQIITQIEQEAHHYGFKPNDLISRLVFGVGTRLITSMGDSALSGVYKLVAIDDNGGWKPTIKIAETTAKTLNPGYKLVWRIYDKRGNATADLISTNGYDPGEMDNLLLRHPIDHSKSRTLRRERISKIEPILVKVLDEGKIVRESPPIEEMRRLRERDMDCLDAGVKRLMNPHIYHVSLTQELWALKQNLIKSVNGNSSKR